MISEVYMICVAYESGVGKGRSGRLVANPYSDDGDVNGKCHEAWNHGYREGQSQVSRGVETGDRSAAARIAELIEANNRELAARRALRAALETTSGTIESIARELDQVRSGLDCHEHSAVLDAVVSQLRDTVSSAASAVAATAPNNRA